MLSSIRSLNPTAITAGKLPPGLSNHDRYSSFNGVPLTAVLGLVSGIAVTLYCIRIYTKAFIVRRLHWDDLVITLGVIGALIDVICFGIASLDGPLGRHMWNITLAQFLENSFIYTGYIEQVTSSATLGFIKLAIFLFYLEVFWPLRWCRLTIMIGASLSSAFYLSMTIVQLYFMTPRQGETMAKHFGGALAHRVTSLSIPTTSVGLAIDVLLFVIPMKAVLQLQMAQKMKFRLISIFFVGILAIMGSILSLSFKVKTYGNPDLTYHLTLVSLFVTLEMLLGICISCVPIVCRAAKFHQAKLASISESILSPLLRFKTFTSTKNKSGAVSDVERGSEESKDRLVELQRLKEDPTCPPYP